MQFKYVMVCQLGAKRDSRGYEGTLVARQRHVMLATDTQTTEVLLEAAFSVRCVLRLYKDVPRKFLQADC
jgi:hypothetical protein